MRSLLLAMVIGALALAACGEETIVLATVAGGDDAGTPRQNDKLRCSSNKDCLEEDYCSKERCDSLDGKCFHKPLFCEKEEKLEALCGCTSGITYFNDCYRRQAGEESATNGECGDNGTYARTCDGNGVLCPTGAICQLGPSGGPVDSPACGLPLGRCWGIITCPPSTRGEWSECSTEPGAFKCVDTCTAIQTGRKFTHEPCPKGPGP